MVQGMSYLKLYYNKACTRELEKDIDGNYIFDSRYFSINSVMPLLVNIWCKNDGSHSAYDVSLTNLESNMTVELPDVKERIKSQEVIFFMLKITTVLILGNEYYIKMRLEYDNI